MGQDGPLPLRLGGEAVGKAALPAVEGGGVRAVRGRPTTAGTAGGHGRGGEHRDRAAPGGGEPGGASGKGDHLVRPHPQPQRLPDQARLDQGKLAPGRRPRPGLLQGRDEEGRGPQVPDQCHSQGRRGHRGRSSSGRVQRFEENAHPERFFATGERPRPGGAVRGCQDAHGGAVRSSRDAQVHS
ncbi:hypothetical protein DSECCO2_597260 [anaerobic digester metagenome]